MPSPLRRPSRSVRAPGRVSRPVRLGHQSTGNFFLSYQESVHTDDEVPQGPHGPVVTQRAPTDAGPTDTSPADVGADGAARAEVAPAEGGAEESGRQPGPDSLPRRTPGSSHAAPGSPPRVPARQGPPARPAPGTAGTVVPAVGEPAIPPGTVPATPPGTAPAVRAEAAPAVRTGAAPATRPAAGALARRPDAEPAWGAVLATTFALWAKRRVEKRWLRVLLGLALAAIVFFAGVL